MIEYVQVFRPTWSAGHPRRPGDTAVRQRLARFERVADQIDTAVAIGDLSRADRFAAPDVVRHHLRRNCPDPLTDPAPSRPRPRTTDRPPPPFG